MRGESGVVEEIDIEEEGGGESGGWGSFEKGDARRWSSRRFDQAEEQGRGTRGDEVEASRDVDGA